MQNRKRAKLNRCYIQTFIGARLEEMPLRAARQLLQDLPAAIRRVATDRRGRTGA